MFRQMSELSSGWMTACTTQYWKFGFAARHSSKSSYSKSLGSFRFTLAESFGIKIEEKRVENRSQVSELLLHCLLYLYTKVKDFKTLTPVCIHNTALKRQNAQGYRDAKHNLRIRWRHRLKLYFFFANTGSRYYLKRGTPSPSAWSPPNELRSLTLPLSWTELNLLTAELLAHSRKPTLCREVQPEAVSFVWGIVAAQWFLTFCFAKKEKYSLCVYSLTL